MASPISLLLPVRLRCGSFVERGLAVSQATSPSLQSGPIIPPPPSISGSIEFAYIVVSVILGNLSYTKWKHKKKTSPSLTTEPKWKCIACKLLRPGDWKSIFGTHLFIWRLCACGLSVLYLAQVPWGTASCSEDLLLILLSCCAIFGAIIHMYRIWVRTVYIGVFSFAQLRPLASQETCLLQSKGGAGTHHAFLCRKKLKVPFLT